MAKNFKNDDEMRDIGRSLCYQLEGAKPFEFDDEEIENDMSPALALMDRALEIRKHESDKGTSIQVFLTIGGPNVSIWVHPDDSLSVYVSWGLSGRWHGIVMRDALGFADYAREFS